jgi:hypothetical protein
LPRYRANIRNTGVLHNKHAGDTIIVVGSGPSLKDVPLDRFSDIPTIGSNRILQHPTFKPTYLMVADRRPYMEEIENLNYAKNAKRVRILLSTTIFDPRIKCHGTAAQPMPGFGWYPWTVGVSSTPFNGTSFAMPLCSFASISGPLLQAAVIMGAKRIGLVGIDMEAPKSGKSIHFYKEAKWEGGRSGAYSPGQQIINDKLLKRYKGAIDWLRSKGVMVSNLSPWKNTAFSRAVGTQDLEKFLADR